MRRKTIMVFSTLFMIFMLVLFIIYLVKGDSSRWQVALGGIVVSGLPLLLLRSRPIPFNTALIIGYYLFLFCTTYLGSLASFYLHFKWWDTTLHLYKGIFVGFAAIALYKIFIPARVRKDVSPWMIFLLVFSLPVIATVLWEIYEFVGDQFFTHTMQLGGNKDTMLDIIFGMAGGLVVAVYAWLRRGKV
ncbi:membrane-spanning protein [Fictibacillus terranigra]|uniref:Membrane-spanning protein n=1 Tax=Fictibacillus terranigra TaxID=3058424 RepID=A0ABT8E1D8_9BACL|nr:membrane-spanning protein [Fictibacillus sp. CENA-BCM004]MDN4071707.1 membrane-spanning protein [Fictibacillus sp. CENA-BCM004]